MLDRKSTRLNSSHLVISYAVFCLKKKKDRPPLDNPRRAHSHVLTPTRPHCASRTIDAHVCMTDCDNCSCRLLSCLSFFFFAGGATPPFPTFLPPPPSMD